ncbi:hypothetical protein HYU16_01565 [Candidatus Woesearchaeota archaeon]|nr:hypothetical protein [Candidatus Woesearchaeota archaeon]
MVKRLSEPGRFAVVGHEAMEVADVDDPFDYAALRALVIATTPKTHSDILFYDDIKGAADPYVLLPPEVEPKYPHELREAAASDLVLVVDRVLRYLSLPANLPADSNHDLAQVLEDYRKLVGLLDEVRHKATAELLMSLKLQGYRLRDLHLLPDVLSEQSPEVAADVETALGHQGAVRAFMNIFTNDDLESRLAAFDKAHLAARLPDGAYVATMEGRDSYLRSSFSNGLLYAQNLL